MGKGCSRLFKGEDYRLEILMLGLNGSGKTTIVNSLEGNSEKTTQPTIAPSFSAGTKLQKGLKGLRISFWDFSGDERFRDGWSRFVRQPQVLMFAVDSSDVARITEAKQYLSSVLRNPKIVGIPVLILANKQDLPGALSPTELAEKLSVVQRPENPCDVQAVCPLTSEGLHEAVYKLADMDKRVNKTSSPVKLLKHSPRESGAPSEIELGGFSPEVLSGLDLDGVSVKVTYTGPPGGVIRPLFA